MGGRDEQDVAGDPAYEHRHGFSGHGWRMSPPRPTSGCRLGLQFAGSSAPLHSSPALCPGRPAKRSLLAGRSRPSLRSGVTGGLSGSTSRRRHSGDRRSPNGRGRDDATPVDPRQFPALISASLRVSLGCLEARHEVSPVPA
jgi:hypothetical protein